MAAATTTVTVSGHTYTVTGTKPYKAVQAGGLSGAYDIVDSTGLVTNAQIDGQGATSIFAAHAHATVDAIVTALNA